MSAPTLANVRALAEKLGADVSYGRDASRVEVVVDAPDGRVWVDGGCLGLVGWTYVGTGGTRAMYADLLMRMQHGHRAMHDRERRDADL